MNLTKEKIKQSFKLDDFYIDRLQSIIPTVGHKRGLTLVFGIKTSKERPNMIKYPVSNKTNAEILEITNALLDFITKEDLEISII